MQRTTISSCLCSHWSKPIACRCALTHSSLYGSKTGSGTYPNPARIRLRSLSSWTRSVRDAESSQSVSSYPAIFFRPLVYLLWSISSCISFLSGMEDSNFLLVRPRHGCFPYTYSRHRPTWPPGASRAGGAPSVVGANSIIPHFWTLSSAIDCVQKAKDSNLWRTSPESLSMGVRPV